MNNISGFVYYKTFLNAKTLLETAKKIEIITNIVLEPDSLLCFEVLGRSPNKSDRAGCKPNHCA